MLLFERCASAAAYKALIKAVNDDDEGKPRFLAGLEEQALAGDKPDLGETWDDPFIREWLTVPPRLGHLDLRGVLYVSRENTPLITPEDRLSSEGAAVLAAVLEHPDMASEVHERLTRLPRAEMTIIMDRVLERARQVQEWGVPPILDACLEVTAADPTQGQRLAAFLQERPPAQIKPSIVPKIGGEPWAKDVFDVWVKGNVAAPVKTAITKELKPSVNI